MSLTKIDISVVCGLEITCPERLPIHCWQRSKLRRRLGRREFAVNMYHQEIQIRFLFSLDCISVDVLLLARCLVWSESSVIKSAWPMHICPGETAQSHAHGVRVCIGTSNANKDGSMMYIERFVSAR